MGIVKKSSVLILITNIDGIDYIVLEKRALTLKSQPGDICLPGGRVEKGEKPKTTALRETMEELNIKKSDIEYIGKSDIFVSPYGQEVFSFVARTNLTEFSFSKDEVDKVYLVPIDFFINNNPLENNININPTPENDFPYHLIVNGKDYKFLRGSYKQYFWVYEDITIWGTTAKIIKRFIDILKEEG